MEDTFSTRSSVSVGIGLRHSHSFVLWCCLGFSTGHGGCGQWSCSFCVAIRSFMIKNRSAADVWRRPVSLCYCLYFPCPSCPSESGSCQPNEDLRDDHCVQRRTECAARDRESALLR